MKWVIDNGSLDGYKAMARVRLAGIYLEEKAYDEGMKIMSGNFPEPFVSLAEDRKGDLLVAQDRFEEARKAYQTALDKASPDDPGKQLIELKLEEIGGSSATKG